MVILFYFSLENIFDFISYILNQGDDYLSKLTYFTLGYLN
tara:strand:- start:2102 stop:2221 length:120 start_codon:yes stop_codon:yes gene_type:complete